MTDPILGRVLPVQIAMIYLAGIDLPGWYEWDANHKGKEEQWRHLPLGRAVAVALVGRSELICITGKDLGFGLKAWRDFLIKEAEHDDWGYRHPYATVDHYVCEGIKREDRDNLEALATKAWPAYVETLSLENLELMTRPDH